MVRQLIKLSNLKPNPHRDLKNYPIDKQRVAELVESIKATCFWDNLTVRPVGDKFEIAEGHQRLAALRELYPPDHEISCNVQAMDDATMIKVMYRSNDIELGSQVSRRLECVEGVIKFLTQQGRPATIENVADLVLFLPASRRIEDVALCLDALNLIDEGILSLREVNSPQSWAWLKMRVKEGKTRLEQCGRRKDIAQREAAAVAEARRRLGNGADPAAVEALAEDILLTEANRTQ